MTCPDTLTEEIGSGYYDESGEDFGPFEVEVTGCDLPVDHPGRYHRKIYPTGEIMEWPKVMPML